MTHKLVAAESKDGFEQKVSKQERSYQTIRQRILDGTYGPGYRLTIDTLAKEIGVSQVPIREATRRLEAEGWVIYRRNIGPQVSPIDHEKWAQAMVTLAVLEGYATAKAVPHMGAKEIHLLREGNASMKEAIESLDIIKFSHLNRQFHYEIYGSCPNGYLVDHIKDTWSRLDAIRVTVFTYIPQRSRSAIAEHEEIVELIEQGADFSKIERLAREHKMRTIQAYIDHRTKGEITLDE